MIRNIIFDVGNVLVEYSWERMLKALHITGEAYDAVAKATALSPMWNELDRSRMSDEAILEGFIQNAPEYEKEIRLVWDNIPESIHCYDYSVEWVRKFKKKGYKTYILSNYSRRGYEMTKQELPFVSDMDGVVFSFEVCQTKPEPEIYQTLFEKYNLKPEECVFMDDNEKNVIAAREAGMQAIWFKNKEQAETELEKLGVDIS
ncbi:HAD family hydrolase [Roseburia sp. 499]|uniref:HAD family hydrolase n=1 Tax=Roseburia sp. 499 TaxID=1261634 RepID=UPI00095167D9|nr:HAD family phosphatase [Roseburia sp. 499]WVK70944.1 HAD family phosphatase [Roseburia sp. 499]